MIRLMCFWLSVGCAAVAGHVYSVTAFRAGFVGQNFSTVALRAKQVRKDIDLHSNAVPASLEEMPNAALVAAYANDKYFTAEYGRFSADGTLFAMATTDGMVSSSPDQVWLYNLATKRLLAVTEKPTKTVGESIHSLVWVGNTLWMEGYRTKTTGRFLVKANVQGVEEVHGATPPEVEKAFQAALTQGGPRWMAARVGQYKISVVKNNQHIWELHAHGLKGTGAAKDSFVISYANTQRFVADPTAPVVFYQDLDGAFAGRICSFDVTTRRQACLYIPSRIDLGLLAAQKQGRDFKLAYVTTDQACRPTGQLDRELLPGRARTIRVCFVKMRAPRD